MKMSNARYNNAGSPAKPILATPPRPNLISFFYHKDNKKLGLTPNGKNTIPLEMHEGKHHIRARDMDTQRIISEFSPITSPDKGNIQLKENKLYVKLSNLKNRTDHDYNIIQKDGQIDDNHYMATKTKLAECIALFKACYSDCSDKNSFIEKHNRNIKNADLYNPFILQLFYSTENFELEKYTELNKRLNYRAVLTLKHFENNTNKRKRLDDDTENTEPNFKKLKLFVPRTLRKKHPAIRRLSLGSLTMKTKI